VSSRRSRDGSARPCAPPTSAGIAQLQKADGAAAFFQRADDALYRAKGSGKAQVFAATS
jgi:PleD family two-component response regulator